MRFTDISPGVGSLVGGEFSQSLGARLLVSALRVVGATCNIDSTCFFKLLQPNEFVYRLLVQL